MVSLSWPLTNPFVAEYRDCHLYAIFDAICLFKIFASSFRIPYVSTTHVTKWQYCSSQDSRYLFFSSLSCFRMIFLGTCNLWLVNIWTREHVIGKYLDVLICEHATCKYYNVRACEHVTYDHMTILPCVMWHTINTVRLWN